MAFCQGINYVLFPEELCDDLIHDLEDLCGFNFRYIGNSMR